MGKWKGVSLHLTWNLKETFHLLHFYNSISNLGEKRKALRREGEKFEKGKKRQLWKKSKKVAKGRRKYVFKVARTMGKAKEIEGEKIEKVGGIFVVENNQGKKNKKKQ